MSPYLKMTPFVPELQQKARELLESKEVGVVIGYRLGQAAASHDPCVSSPTLTMSLSSRLILSV